MLEQKVPFRIYLLFQFILLSLFVINPLVLLRADCKFFSDPGSL